MIELRKGDMVIRCETEAELRIARAVFAEPDEVAEMASLGEIESLAIGLGYLGDYAPARSTLPDGIYRSTPHLTVVPEVEVSHGDSVPTVQHIPVSARNMEVLDAVMLFPDGVPSNGIAELIGVPSPIVSGRLQILKDSGLVEKVPGHRAWRATQLARRSKLVLS